MVSGHLELAIHHILSYCQVIIVIQEQSEHMSSMRTHSHLAVTLQTLCWQPVVRVPPHTVSLGGIPNALQCVM